MTTTKVYKPVNVIPVGETFYWEHPVHGRLSYRKISDLDALIKDETIALKGTPKGFFAVRPNAARQRVVSFSLHRDETWIEVEDTLQRFDVELPEGDWDLL